MKKMLMTLLSIIAVAFLETILEILKDKNSSGREMDESEDEKYRPTYMSEPENEKPRPTYMGELFYAIRVPRRNYMTARAALREKGLI